MLKSVGAMSSEGEHLTLVCQHWRNFPPFTALNTQDIETQRKDKGITDSEYQQHLVWKRICGLLVMNKKKCRHCPHVRYMKEKDGLWVLETPDGKLATPIVDLPTMENLSRQKAVQRPPQNPGKRVFTPEGKK